MTENPDSSGNIPFVLRDCALVSIAVGLRAQNLKELHERLRDVPVSSIYHHFWGRLLRPQFDEPEYTNDFASWAWRGLNDKPLAERLSMIIPADFSGLEELREELLDVIAERLDEREIVPWAKPDQQFHFLRSQIIVFETGRHFFRPEEIQPQLATFNSGSIYYHFIDARRRTPLHQDDFSSWLEGLNEPYHELAAALEQIDPYFSSLEELRELIVATFRQHLPGGA